MTTQYGLLRTLVRSNDDGRIISTTVSSPMVVA